MSGFVGVMTGKEKSVTDLIGERPYDKRKRKREAEEAANVDPEIEKEQLRQIALEKGLNPTF